VADAALEVALEDVMEEVSPSREELRVPVLPAFEEDELCTKLDNATESEVEEAIEVWPE
jgi:hypothetical protein